MNMEILSGAVFNGILIGAVGWLLNDKLKTMTHDALERYRDINGRMARIESLFFRYGAPDHPLTAEKSHTRT